MYKNKGICKMFSHPMPYITIESTDHQAILAKLKLLAPEGAHFTNGTYALPQRITVATTLAGFKYVLDNNNSALPLVIAINSDKSMQDMKKTGFEEQNARAKDVAIPLAETFPHNRIIVIFYDEPTPNALYEVLSEKNMTCSLSKWGYGTDSNAPRIEGAEYFQIVYGFPFVDDLKAVCWQDTERGNQQGRIEVADLRGTLITPQRQCLFPLPGHLSAFQDASVVKTFENDKPTSSPF